VQIMWIPGRNGVWNERTTRALSTPRVRAAALRVEACRERARNDRIIHIGGADARALQAPRARALASRTPGFDPQIHAAY
jgi:hypothetical protein